MSTVLTDYIRSLAGPREEILDEILRDAILREGMPSIQVDDNEARVLQLLTMLLRPRRVIEVGTLFGYSTIHIARGIPEGGKLISLEVDPHAASLAQRYVEQAGVEDRVEIMVGDAAELLSGMERDSVDMIFIDADKKSYPDYLKACFPLLRPGGLLVADDAFAQGDFSAESEAGAPPDREFRAINTYNRAVMRSNRLFSALVGTKNGLMISYKG
ncbi:O-methyltransferase [Streptosporangium sp. NBC_01756]|uniref:O-methyltransferase n=1 Tax=Streptosporangium sp. NBC_01756 TaxID=2975950 RepID=UPI002DDAB562|nr:O-methyltransferase [Streptosporangium sp. NBC_01756]WSC85284.1 O-methyltransferase [Streptosporangium sp. NBC_01756]